MSTTFETEVLTDQVSVVTDAVNYDSTEWVDVDPVDEPEPTELLQPIDDSERRFWMELELLGKISECSREIEESEQTIETMKSEIKEAKEFLKGQDILLRRLSSKLRDVIAGKPLPIDPNKPSSEAAVSETTDEDDDETCPNADWESVKTTDLLSSTKGIGKAKLEAIIELAPTAGGLERLRGEASLQHKSFREMLPKGCGQAIADAIEDELIKLVAECSAGTNDDDNPDADEGGEEPKNEIDEL